MTKHYFTAIYVKGITDDSILQMIEPDGCNVVRADVCNFHVQDWDPVVSAESFYTRPPGIYRITGYATISECGWVRYGDVQITPAKSYSFKFEE